MSDADEYESTHPAGDPHPTAEEPQDGKKPKPPVFTDVAMWVERWLAPSLSIQLTGDGRGLVWCPQWWAHKPVAVRLHHLWLAWEEAKRIDTMSDWWVSHADPHLKELCDGEVGPMRRCSEYRHIPTKGLTVMPAPDGWAEKIAAQL